MSTLSKSYQQPRPAQQEDNVFDDKRTGRRRADKYTGKDAGRLLFGKEVRDTVNKRFDDRNFLGTNIKPTPKQKIRRMIREKSGTKT